MKKGTKQDKKVRKRKQKQQPREEPGKLNPAWLKMFVKEFRAFWRATKFPEPERNGERGSYFNYPESLIMLSAVLSVKCKVKTYLGIHRLAEQYWEYLSPDKALQPISESQLRERLKKSGTHLESLQDSFFSYFLKVSKLSVASADKMMLKAKGPVWHRKQQKQGVIPEGLRALDTEATWSYSNADG
jgi:hypothetical protein